MMLSMATKDGWERLARAAVARRAQLGLTQMEVAHRGPMSLDRVQAIEGAKRTSYRPATLAALERALEWEYGSVAAVQDGGPPTVAGAGEAHDSKATLAELEELLARAQEKLNQLRAQGDD